MAREKVTIMADRAKIAAVCEATGSTTTSDAIDRALDELIRIERLRRDIAAYTEIPPTVEELALGLYRPGSPDLTDDTDWEALYRDDA